MQQTITKGLYLAAGVLLGAATIEGADAAHLRQKEAQMPQTGMPDGYTPLVYPAEWDRVGVPKTFVNDHHKISYVDSVTNRRKTYKQTDGDVCRQCCQFGGYHHPGTICAFEDVESLDDCDRLCGDKYDLTPKDEQEGVVWTSLLETRARVKAKSKIFHEVFFSLAERRSQEATKIEEVADQASTALAQLKTKGKNGGGGKVLNASALNQIEKALERAQAEQASEAKAAKAASAVDAKVAAKAKVAEKKMDLALNMAEKAGEKLNPWVGADAIPIPVEKAPTKNPLKKKNLAGLLKK